MERSKQVAVIVRRNVWTKFGMETAWSMWDTSSKVVENHPQGLPDTD